MPALTPAIPMMSDDPTPAAPPAATAVEDPPAPSATKPRTKPRPDGRVEQLPPYRVLLHNDDHNDPGDVILTLVDLTPLKKLDATRVTLEAHNTGVALILVTHKERAELYQDQFTSRRLTVTIEPAE